METSYQVMFNDSQSTDITTTDVNCSYTCAGGTGIEQRQSDGHEFNVVVKVCLVLVLVVIFLIGVFGNLCTCVIVYRKTLMRSAINLLLVNIAVADLTLTVAIVPFTILRIIYPHFHINLNICIAVSVLKDCLISVITYTLLIVSADRFLMIVYKKDRLYAGTAKTYMVSVWWLSLFLTFPQFLSNMTDMVIFDETLCDHHCRLTSPTYTSVHKPMYTLCLLTLSFYIPMLIMFYFYISILRSVQITSKKIHNHSGSAISVSVTQYSSKLGLPPVVTPYRLTGDLNAKRRSLGTIFMLYTSLLCCWLPYMVKRNIEDMFQGTTHHQPVFILLLTLGILKSALFPIIFCFRNKKYRTACFSAMPSQVRLPKKHLILRIKSRRINPHMIYQCGDKETVI